ncbi:glycosyltransferase 87 family protein [Streptomyces sp. NPDC059396]|uniref:glycosyltransferase 87 family protein n=1 Tax=Streptomyces sp. NPDC059396 TaxID=3346819 RepID=UPI0036CE3DFE
MTVPVLVRFVRNSGRSAAPHRSLLIAGAVCLASFTAFWIAQRAAAVSMIDLLVYRAEGRTVLEGRDLYAMRATAARLPTTYPPFAALLFTPLTLPSVPVLRTLATAGNLLLLVVFVRLSLRLVLQGKTPPPKEGTQKEAGTPKAAVPWAATLWVAAFAVWCEPVWTTLRYGQINLLLAVAVLWDLCPRAPRDLRDPRGRGATGDQGAPGTPGQGHRWAGAGIGFAAAVKLTPALFAVLLLLTGLVRARRAGWNPWLRQAATAGAVFAGTTLLAAALLPGDSRRYWTGILFEAARAGRAEDTANQSLRGVLARLLHTADPGLWWPPVAVLVAGAGLTAAVAAALRGERAGAVAACAATALLISPVSWSHHWVWCVPVVLFLAARGATGRGATARGATGRAAAVWLVFCSYALWWVPHGSGAPELAQGVTEMALSALYPLTALALIGWLLGETVRARGYGQAVANE